jgi:hypothetical protein
MRWHNGQIRRSQNPDSEEVFQDCLTKWEESVAHSILARSLFTPPKAVYICADQPCPSLFRLQLGGGPYITEWLRVRVCVIADPMALGTCSHGEGLPFGSDYLAAE